MIGFALRFSLEIIAGPYEIVAGPTKTACHRDGPDINMSPLAGHGPNL